MCFSSTYVYGGSVRSIKRLRHHETCQTSAYHLAAAQRASADVKTCPDTSRSMLKTWENKLSSVKTTRSGSQNNNARSAHLVTRGGSHNRCSCPFPAAVAVAGEAKNVRLRIRYPFREERAQKTRVSRTSGMLLPSRPPHRSRRPSARAAAAAYIRAHGPSPLACTLCHLYGFTAVSRAQASASGCASHRCQS